MIRVRASQGCELRGPGFDPGEVQDHESEVAGMRNGSMGKKRTGWGWFGTAVAVAVVGVGLSPFRVVGQDAERLQELRQQLEEVQREIARELAEVSRQWQREWREAQPRLEETRRDLAEKLHGVGFVWSSMAVIGVWLELRLDRDLEDVGARVTRIAEGGPADEAGVREGDIIVSFNGHDLTEPLDDDVEERLEDDQSFPAQRLIALLAEMHSGEPVVIEVERDGERLSLSVTPGEREDILEFPQLRWARLNRPLVDIRMADTIFDGYRRDMIVLPRGSGFRLFDGTDRWIHGLDLVELNPGLGAYFGTEEGVMVADVEEDVGLGLRPGDVVVDVDGRQVEDAAELRRILSSYETGDEIEFRIWRDGAETTVVGTIE